MLQSVKKNSPSYPYEPDYVVPVAPGELLREKLQEMEMTTEQFAEQSGLAIEAVELFYIGRLPVDTAIAETLERITQMPKDYWLRFEKQYRDDLILAEQKYRLAPTG